MQNLKDGKCFPLSKIAGAKQGSGMGRAAIGAFSVAPLASGHYYQLIATQGWTFEMRTICAGVNNPNAAFCNALTPSQASQIDAKIDDGQPMSGTVRAFDGSAQTGGMGTASLTAVYNTPTQGAAGSSNCVNTGSTPYSYNVANDDLYRCALNIKAAF
jgi:hypothetical protein